MSLIYLCMGMIFFALGIHLWSKTNRDKKRCSMETMATIIDIKKGSEYDVQYNGDVTTYAPVFEYYVGGKQIIKEHVALRIRQGKVGDKVVIRYSKNNPKDIFVYNKAMHIVYSGFMIVGAILAVYGALKLKSETPEFLNELLNGER